MKIMQYSDHIYIEPFETEESLKYNDNEDEIELEQYKSFTIDNKSKITSVLPKKEQEIETKIEQQKEQEQKQKVKEETESTENKEKKVEVIENEPKREIDVEPIVSPSSMNEIGSKIETKSNTKPEPKIEEEKIKIGEGKKETNENKIEEELKVKSDEQKPIQQPEETKGVELEEGNITTPSPIDSSQNNNSWGVLEQDYFSPKKRTVDDKIDLHETFKGEVKLHKSSKISILIEENQQLKKEIERNKIEIENYKNSIETGNKNKSSSNTSSISSNKKDKNEEEKYSLLMVVFVAILFFLVGKVL